MGLDSVELVMEWEDEFKIEIPDAHRERTQTIGDVVKYVAVRFSCLDDSERVADIRRRIGVIDSAQMGVPLDSLSDEMQFIEDPHLDWA